MSTQFSSDPTGQCRCFCTIKEVTSGTTFLKQIVFSSFGAQLEFCSIGISHSTGKYRNYCLFNNIECRHLRKHNVLEIYILQGIRI